MFFLRTVRLSLTWLEVFTKKQHVSFKMAQDPPCSGIRRSITCLFWSTTSAKLCWFFRAILRNLIPRNLILGVFFRMVLICSSEQAFEVSRVLTGILSVLFYFLPHVDLWVVNPGAMTWYLDCCGGRKYYRVRPSQVGWGWSLEDPSFRTLIRTSVPGTYSGGSLESFGSSWHLTSTYLIGIAQWPLYKTGGVWASGSRKRSLT